MGMIGRALSYLYRSISGVKVSDIKTDTGGGDNRTAQHFEPANQTSRPIPGDYAALLPVPGSGRQVAIGFLDPKNPQDLNDGEHKSYSRDSEGVIMASVTLKNDGSLVLGNANGSLTINPDGSVILTNQNGSLSLLASGDIDLNGATVDITGAGDFPSSLSVGGKDLAEHDHAITSGSSAPGPTGPNN